MLADSRAAMAGPRKPGSRLGAGIRAVPWGEGGGRGLDLTLAVK